MLPENDNDAVQPLRTYQVDENTVRVNNPDPDEPDKLVRRLADGAVKSYDVRKRRD